VERERIEVPVKLIQDELAALATVVASYYSKLTGVGVPRELADRLVLDFHSWLINQYRLTSDRQ